MNPENKFLLWVAVLFILATIIVGAVSQCRYPQPPDNPYTRPAHESP